MEMLDFDRFDAGAYVAAAATAVGLDFAPERQRHVVAAFELLVRVAAPALTYPLPADVQPAPVFSADAP